MAPSTRMPGQYSRRMHVERGDDLIRTERDEQSITLWTGNSIVRRSRQLITMVCSALIVAGLILTYWNLTGLLLVIASIVCLVAVPQRVRSLPLLTLSLPAELITLHQNGKSHGSPLPASAVLAVRGEYGTKGWDPFIAVYAVLDGGNELELMNFPGSQEMNAQHACSVLGELLNVPATYRGAFD